MAVFLILLVMIGAILSSTSKIADNSDRTNNSAQEARQVLDRIGLDLNGMIIRPDMDQLVSKLTPGNDKMVFYSLVSGYTGTTVLAAAKSPMSLIGYRINTNAAAAPVLQRLDQGLTWEGTNSLAYLTFPARTSVTGTVTPSSSSQIPGMWDTTWTGTTTATAPYWHQVGSQVFRFEVCYQLQNGTMTTNCPGYSSPGSITNTAAIVVAIAILDSKTRKLITTQAQWTSLITALSDPTDSDLSQNPPVLMDTTWNNALQSSTFPFPAAIASHIKVYQRWYYLNAPKFQ